MATAVSGQIQSTLNLTLAPVTPLKTLPNFIPVYKADYEEAKHSIISQATSSNFPSPSEALAHAPAIIPEDFEAIRPLNFLDRIYFGGSNDLLGLRPVAIAQQRMPDPMLRNLHTLYIRSSIGLKKRTRLVMHCECLLFVKSMSNMAFLLPQLGLRQRF